jgi:hypothetical protein
MIIEGTITSSQYKRKSPSMLNGEQLVHLFEEVNSSAMFTIWSGGTPGAYAIKLFTAIIY